MKNLMKLTFLPGLLVAGLFFFSGFSRPGSETRITEIGPEGRITKRMAAPSRTGNPFLYGKTPDRKEGLLARMSGNVMLLLAKKHGLTTIQGKNIPEEAAPSRPSISPKALSDSPVGTDPSVQNNEPSIAVRPNNQNIVVVASHYYPPGPLIATYTSFDRGDTWSGPYFLPKRFPSDFLSDPVIRYSPNSASLYACYMSIRGDVSTADIMVSRSTNNGLSWQTPKVALPGADYDGDGFLDFPDKPWLGVHPFPNTLPANAMVYVTTTIFEADGDVKIAFSRSTNSASSFTPLWLLSYGDGRVLQGSRPIGGRGGDVLISFYTAAGDGWLTGDFDIDSVYFSGYGTTPVSWVSAVVDMSYELPYYLGPNQAYHRWWGGMFPSVAMAPNGTAYVVFTADPVAGSADTEDGDIFMVRAPKPYSAWTQPRRINWTGGNAQGYPTVGVKKITGGAIVFAAWEDHVLSPVDNELYDIWGLKHVDDFLSQTYPIRVTDFSSYSDNIFIGDYIDCDAGTKVTPFLQDRVIHVVWTDRSHQTSKLEPDDDVWADMIELFY